MSWLSSDWVECPVCECMTNIHGGHICPGPDVETEDGGRDR